MSSFPGSPRTLRGSIVAVDPWGPGSRVVVFQYNPDSVTRTLRPRADTRQQQDRAADAHRVYGAPTESVTMTVEVDAADQLEANHPVARAAGIAPALATLEMLITPSSARVIADTAMLQAGTIEILPPAGPLTVLVWGPARVLPVRLETLTVTEQAFDQALSPIRASVELTLQVLTYSDLPTTDPGYWLSLRHQVLKETLATVGSATGTATALSDLAGA